MRRALALVCAAAVSTTLLVQTPIARSAPDPDGAEAVLKDDADGPVRIRREGGVATFVGAPAGTDVDNPSVNRGTTVSAAARSHLHRYGAILGADRAGTSLKETRRDRGVAGTDVVRYQQEVDGLPVVGGEVVVTLAGDRDLGSLNANLSASAAVPAATVNEKDARATALALVAKSASAKAEASDQGRWLFDPEAVSWPSATGAHGIWRFEVRAGDDVRRMVFVDDRSGAVLLNVDLIQHIDQVVCDKANVMASVVPCVSGFQNPGESAVIDVDQALNNGAAVGTFYQQFTGVDLAALIGYPTAGGLKLSSTVRVCPTGEDCGPTKPYDNAFWNGQAMFYGEGYAAADDVVGHEMTHGVIERTSDLLYWDQSGAINESLADIIGEIIDHRNPSTGDTAGDWRLGEDLPGGALRDMATPELGGQPDRMTSPLWDTDLNYGDGGGVHTNSGVGNKAFHLISQGGTFNGQTITGIDAGDPDLTKSAVLWIQTMIAVTAFTRYADLGVVLAQACQSLVGSYGFTAANCTAVNKAIAATEMATAPTAEPVRDADRNCPTGTFKRVLLDSESGTDPASKFSGSDWGRTPGTAINSSYGAHAYSNGTAWVVPNFGVARTSTLAATDPIALPAGQPVFLAFRHWHLFEFYGTSGSPIYYDGGTVEVEDVDGSTVYNVSTRPWVHGPTRTLQPPLTAFRSFAGSSRGWVGSRVDLSSYAGRTIRPRFAVRADSEIGFIGWYLDDIELYTCDPAIANLTQPTVTGSAPRVGRVLSVEGTQWNHPEIGQRYQWRRNGAAISGATSQSYTPVAADVSRLLSVTVTGVLGSQAVPLVATASAKVLPGIMTAPAGVYTYGAPGWAAD